MFDMTSRRLPVFLLLLLTGLAIQAEAQRGGRGDGSRRRPNPAASGNDLSGLKFVDRLWFGAGGNFGFQGGNNQSFTQLGLTPQVGYKFTDWLSAGPRFGADLNIIKGFARSNVGPIESRRFTLVNYTAGAFVRGRFRQFYAQTEFNVISRELPFSSNGAFVIGDDTNEIETERDGEPQLQVGIGYAPPNPGGISTDFGIYYNLFDDVESFNRSPIELRINLLFRY